MIGLKAGRIDGSVGIFDRGAACASLNGTGQTDCFDGYSIGFFSVCTKTKFGCSEKKRT